MKDWLYPVGILSLLGILIVSTDCRAESYAYGEVFIHHNLNSQGWVGDTPAGIAAGLHSSLGESKWYGEIEIRHTSNIDRGQPFNDKYETWVDSVGITIGRKFKW